MKSRFSYVIDADDPEELERDEEMLSQNIFTPDHNVS